MSVLERFRSLHASGTLFVMPNAWDVGSAKILVDLGFSAIATTSSGSAAAMGRADGDLDRDAVLRHVAEVAAAVPAPVSADLENCFGDEPEAVAGTVALAVASGGVGASVEDWSGSAIYDRGLAVDRVRAAVEAAAGRLIVTARAENLIRGVHDLDDTLDRLRAFAGVGADVVFAPGLRSEDEIRAAVDSVEVPVSVLVGEGVPPVGTLAELGVRRLSVGGGFAFAAYGAVVKAAREIQGAGTYGYTDGAAVGRAASLSALHRARP